MIKKKFDDCIVYGEPVSPSEGWTADESVNKVMVDTLGYIPLEKQVQRLIEAGENLLVNRLSDGYYSNSDTEEFVISPLDDIGTKTLDELYELQKSTAENFHIRKAVINKFVKDKLAEEEAKKNLVPVDGERGSKKSPSEQSDTGK